MNFTILGAGNTGKANCAFLSSLGHHVVLYDRTYSRLAAIASLGLTATGMVEGTFTPEVTCDLSSAVADAQVILVCTTAAGHLPLARALKGHLRPGQDIVVTNCCWGAVEFDRELGGEAREKCCTISETSGQLILCSSPAPNAVYLKTIKKRILLAAARPEQTKSVLARLSPVFPQFQPAGSVLETSLNNSNPISHGPLALFNITRIENGEDYLLFGTGATPRVARFMEKIDRERIDVVRACGVPAPTELEMLNSFWPQPQDSIYHVLHNTAAYSVTKGPTSLDHRYLTEDLPYGLVPYVRLGRKLGVETPYLDALIHMFGLYMETDYFSLGPSVEEIDFARYL